MMRRALIFCLALLAGSVLPPAAGAQDRPATHTVVQGETLYRIATRYGLSVADLQRLNDLEGTAIRVGQVLRLREEAAVVIDEAVVPPPEEPGPAAPVMQSVDGTRSLFDVAFRLGVSPDSLLALNPDLPAVFAAGDSVAVPAAFATRTIRVRSGDTLFRIAERHGTTVAALRALNGLESDLLRVGQRLDVPSGDQLPDDIGLPRIEDRGSILVYPDRFVGRLTASGRPYDPDELTIAHPALPLGTVVLLVHPGTGRSVFAEITDRTPTREGHVAEVSRAVAEALGSVEGDVLMRVVDRPGGGAGP